MRLFANAQNDGINKMGNFKFLILALGLAVAQGSMAVTLPATSYVDDPSDYVVYGTDENGNAVVVSAAFLMLGSDKGAIEDYCTTTYGSVATKALCTQCCSDKLEEACKQDPANCSLYEADADKCTAACASYSLPLEGGMYILLALAVAFGAAKALMLHKKSGVELSLQCCNA